MLFGEYLLEHGLVSESVLLAALDDQARSRPFTGTLAVDLGYLSVGQVLQVLNEQTITEKKFLATAIHLGFMNRSQADRIIALQRDRQTPIGQVLQQRAALSSKQLSEALKGYFGRPPEGVTENSQEEMAGTLNSGL